MRPLNEIVEIIETRANAIYGSTNKMLLEKGINQSIVSNMKRKKPSVPNIIDFCKLAEALGLSVDYLLNETSTTLIDAKEIIKDKLTVDERIVIDIYREIDEDGKNLVQSAIREIWADHRQPTAKSFPSKDRSIS